MERYRFTLAEDDPDVLFLMQCVLSGLFPKSSVASFANGEDALKHILQAGTDVLITDQSIGVMSGAQLIREVGRLSSKIRTVMISGNPEAREEARLAGATEFLDKHADVQTLEACIRRLVDACAPASPVKGSIEMVSGEGSGAEQLRPGQDTV